MRFKKNFEFLNVLIYSLRIGNYLNFHNLKSLKDCFVNSKILDKLGKISFQTIMI